LYPFICVLQREKDTAHLLPGIKRSGKRRIGKSFEITR
jgi:hypothetical protein